MMKLDNRFITISLVLLAGATVGLSACSNIETEAKYPTSANRKVNNDGNSIYSRDSVFGKDGLKIFGGKKKEKSIQSDMGVNSFLWRATLDTISFMPLASADPFGGVIITDWYADPKTPNERIKVNAFIMGRELKADGIRIRTFRQEVHGGAWRDAPVSEETARKLEDAILTRARQLRIAHLADEK